MLICDYSYQEAAYSLGKVIKVIVMQIVFPISSCLFSTRSAFFITKVNYTLKGLFPLALACLLVWLVLSHFFVFFFQIGGMPSEIHSGFVCLCVFLYVSLFVHPSDCKSGSVPIYRYDIRVS